MTAIGSALRRVGVRIRSDAGAVATEYGLVLMLIALAIVVAATLYGLSLAGLIGRAPDAFP
jgi:Flp pilus assembly pilin Flp